MTAPVPAQMRFDTATGKIAIATNMAGGHTYPWFVFDPNGRAHYSDGTKTWEPIEQWPELITTVAPQ